MNGHTCTDLHVWRSKPTGKIKLSRFFGTTVNTMVFRHTQTERRANLMKKNDVCGAL
nr:unnamed protein product [Callosobruchus chinensis]